MIAGCAALGVGCESGGGGSGGSAFVVVGFEPDGTTDSVLRNQHLEFIFSDPIDPGSVSESALHLRSGEDLIPGRIEIEGRTIRWFPVVLAGDRNDYVPDNHPPTNGIGLAGGTRYTLVMIGGSPYSIRNTSGEPLAESFQASFRTSFEFLPEEPPVPPRAAGLPAFDPPPLVEGDPSSPAPEDWPILDPSSVGITVGFTEAMHPDTIDPFDGLVVTNVTPGNPPPPGAGEVFLFTPSLAPAGNAVTLRSIVTLGDNPASSLPSWFEIRLTEHLTDLAGHPLDGETIFHFRTADKPGERNYAIFTETFDTDENEDADATSAVWDKGVLEGRGVNARFHDFVPQDTNFNLPHPLVEAGNPVTPIGCRFQMKFGSGDVSAQPGEQIVGMSWSPKSGFVFASTYRDVTIKLGHLNGIDGDPLNREYERNYLPAEGNPKVVYRGDYFIDNSVDNLWVPWPEFDTDFEYDYTRPLVFEYNMPEGGDTFQLFRHRVTGGAPRNRHFSNGDQPYSITGSENTKYHHRFYLVSKKSIGQSVPLYTGNAPDYGGFLVLADPNRPGTRIETTWGGSTGGTPSRFTDSIHDADGFSHLAFRIEMTADPLTGVVPRVFSVSFAYAVQGE
jgi:hypothetical protein